MKKWQCIVCGWIYDEAEGCEEESIAPGTAWENVPEDFVCPECGVSKEDFEMIEVGQSGDTIFVLKSHSDQNITPAPVYNTRGATV